MDSLRVEGFELGVDNYLQVAKVWREIPDDSSVEEVLDYLAPIIVSSAEEQARFKAKRAEYAKLLGLKIKNDQPAIVIRSVDQSATATASVPPSSRQYIVGSILFSILAFFVLLWALQGEQANKDTDPITVESPPSENVIGCLDSIALNYNPLATVNCDDCCIYDRVATNNAVPIDTVSWLPTPPLFSSSQFIPLSPIANTAYMWLARYKELLSWFIPLVLLCIALAWFFWYRARKDFLARRTRSEEPPYFLPIKIKNKRQIEMDDKFFFVLDRLRSREAVARQKVDIKATVKASAQNGGFPVLRYRALSRATDYCILIDKQSEQSHQSQLFEHVFRSFVKEEVYAVRFFYDGDPSLCWNDDHPKGLPLEQLLQRYGQARLLIFANGYSFINPVSGTLESWVEVLKGWSQRALMTPVATANWNYREGQLNSVFSVLPASVKGLLQLLRYFDALPVPSLRQWKYELEADDRAIDIDGENLTYSLRKQLNEEQLLWVAACAIYPELHWDLTLKIGEVLRGKQAVSFKDLRELSRLPWFREGYMPQDVRKELLSSGIIDEQTDFNVRAALVEVLEANTPANPESYAFEEHQLHLAINKLLLTKLPEEKQVWLEKYRQLHNSGVQEDIVSMAAFDKQYNRRLDFVLAGPILKYFFSRGRRVLGWRSSIPVIISFLIGLGAWGAVQLIIPNACNGQLVTYQSDTNDEIYCLSNRQDSLRYYTYLTEKSVNSFQTENVIAYADTVFQLILNPADTAEVRQFRNNFFQPTLGNIWNFARSRFISRDFHGAASLFNAYNRIVEQWQNFVPEAADISPISSYESLQYEGLAYLSIPGEDKTKAIEILGKMDGFISSDEVSYPSYLTYLQYAFVDSAYYGRIRVRTAGGYYGFLSVETGQPTWEGVEVPYGYAENYRIVNRGGRNDTIAIVTNGSQRCLVDLEEELIFPSSCFNQLQPFQSSVNQLFGYINENGVVIIPAQFELAGAFTVDDLAWVKVPDEGYNYIHPDGSYLLENSDLEVANDFEIGEAIVQRDGQGRTLSLDGLLLDTLGEAENKKTLRQISIDRVVLNDQTGYVDLYLSAFDTDRTDLFPTLERNATIIPDRRGIYVYCIDEVRGSLDTVSIVDLSSSIDDSSNVETFRVLFLLDLSGSMRGVLLENAKSSIYDFLQENKDEAVTVEFAWFNNLVSFSRNLNLHTFESVVEPVNVGPIGEGKDADLYRAIKRKVEEYSLYQGAKSIVVLTNSKNDIGNNSLYEGAQPLTPVSKTELLNYIDSLTTLDSLFQIFPIAVGENADEVFLDSLTTATYNTNDFFSKNNFPQVLPDKLNEITKENNESNYIASVLPTADEIIYDINPVNFTISYLKPSSTANSLMTNSKSVIFGSAFITKSVWSTLLDQEILRILGIGLVMLIALLIILIFLPPILIDVRHRKNHLRLYGEVKGSKRPKRDPLTLKPFADEDQVIVSLDKTKILSYESWKYYRSSAKGKRIGSFKELFPVELKASDFFKQKGQFRRLNWLWYGALGGLLAWLLQSFILNQNIEGYFELLTFLDNEKLQFSTAVAEQVILGISLGISLKITLAVVVELGVHRKINYVRILVDIILTGLLCGVGFFIIAILTIKVIPLVFLKYLLGWLLCGSVLGLMFSILDVEKVSYNLKSGLIAGGISGVVYLVLKYFTELFYLPVDYLQTGSLMFLGGLFAYKLYEEIEIPSNYYLTCIYPRIHSNWISPVSKWLKTPSIEFVMIGSSNQNRVYLPWSDNNVKASHARLILIDGQPHIKPENGEVFINKKEIKDATFLRDGDEIQFHKNSVTKLRFIATVEKIKKDYRITRGNRLLVRDSRSATEIANIRKQIKINRPS